MMEEKDILLVNCPPWDTRSPPLTLGYLESYIESKGFKVDVIDFNIEAFNAKKKYQYFWDMNLKNYWRKKDDFDKIVEFFKKEIDEVVQKIINNPAKIIAFAVSDPRQAMSMVIIKKIKEINHNKITVVGGPYYLGRDTIGEEEKKLIDLFVIGEGEKAIVEIINRVKQGKSIKNIPGTKLFHKRKEIINQREFPENNLKDYAFPKYKSFNLQLYETKSITSEWSRGCIAKCTFCQNIVHAKTYRFRKAENIFEEIKYNVEKNGIHHMSLADPTINGNIKELEKLCDLLIKNNVRVNWSGLAIPRENMSLELLKKMRRAGCTRLEYGVESGSEKVLRIMKKFHTIKGSEEVLKRTKKAGIKTVLFIMVGYPGETEKDFQKTLAFLKRNRKSIDLVRSVNAPYLMEGTDLMSNPKKYGIIIPEGSKADYQWYTTDGNTTQLRDERVKKTIEFLKKMNIAAELHSLNENKELKIKEKKKIIPSTNKRNTVLMIICPPWDTRMPPLGLGYLAESVRKKGFNPEIFDLNIELYNKAKKNEKILWNTAYLHKWSYMDFHRKLFKENPRTLKKIYKIIKKEKPLLICLSINIGNNNSSLEIIKWIKKRFPESKIAVGGPNIDDNYFMKSEMKDYVDFAVIGEGEIILPQVLQHIKNRRPIDEIEGILIPSKFNQLKNIFSPTIEDLNTIPFPTFKGFNLSKYELKTLPIIGSRGCIRRCSFCSDCLMSRKFRTISAKKTFEEIKFHVTNNKIRNFDFKDLIINGDLKSLEELCDLIIQSGIKIYWIGQGIIRKDMTPNLLRKIRKAGFSHIIYGVESFSNKVLKLMRKGVTKELINKVLQDTHNADIKSSINIIVGFPGESEEDFEETISGIKENSRFISGISSLMPLTIYGNSNIQLKPDSYGIKYPKDIDFTKWLDSGGSTLWEDNNNMNFEERMRRINRMISVLNELKIPSQTFDFGNIDKIKENMKNNSLTINNVGQETILINPPPWGVEDPPTGLSYIATYLKKKGIKVACYDMNIKFYNSVSQELKQLWHVENKNYWKNEKTFKVLMNIFNEKINKTAEEIIKLDSPIIAINVVDPKERITIEVIKKIKKIRPEIKILLGGPGTNTGDARSWYTNSIPELIEGYIVGEGEETLYEATKALLNNQLINKIPGIITYQNREYNDYKPRKLLPIFKDNIWPTYEEFNLEEYHSDALRVEWSRGCIANCAFCKGKTLNPGYRFRNPKSIVEELEYHMKNNNKRRFIVVDLTVNGNLKKLEEVCDLIIKKKLDINWLCQGIPRGDMSLSLLKKMKKAGCYEFQLGVETGSDKVAKIMGKIPTVSEAEECLKLTSKADIRTGLFILVGHPGETEEDFDLTLEFIRRNREYISYIKSINAVHLIDDTDLKENAEKYNLVIPFDKKNSKMPEHGWHYKWRTKDGNTWKVRKSRMRRMYSLLKELNIPLVETNYDEGKENKTKDNKYIITKKINELQDLQNFTNLGVRTNIKGNPVKLFFECLREHGLSFTIDRTVSYIKRGI